MNLETLCMQYQAELLCRVGEDKKTNDVLLLFFFVRPAKIQIRAVWSESSLGRIWTVKDAKFYFVQTT